MNKIFAGYGTFVLMMFAVANYQGYVWTNLLGASKHHKAGTNHYHK